MSPAIAKEDSEPEFTTLMREKTRYIHSLSDSLVQSKFVVGLIDDRVWAEGLLVFYEIFRYLESSMKRLHHSHVGRFYNRDLLRTRFFEADLELYFGRNWRTENSPRKCVENYIAHLRKLELTEPDLLIAYIYHLYLGLLSGGRILRKKQRMFSFSEFSKNSSVVDFDSQIVSQLKKFIKDTTNDIASILSDDMRNRLLEESTMVFKLNCDLIRSVDSANTVAYKIVKWISYTALLVLLAILYFYWRSNSEDKRDELL